MLLLPATLIDVVGEWQSSHAPRKVGRQLSSVSDLAQTHPTKKTLQSENVRASLALKLASKAGFIYR